MDNLLEALKTGSAFQTDRSGQKRVRPNRGEMSLLLS